MLSTEFASEHSFFKVNKISESKNYLTLKINDAQKQNELII